MDGRLYGVCVCSLSRICRCKSPRCSISTASKTAGKANFAASFDEHYGEGAMSDSCRVWWTQHERAVTKSKHADTYDASSGNYRINKRCNNEIWVTFQTTMQGNGGPKPMMNRRQSILSVSWTDNDTGVEKIMWREIDKLSRVVFPGLFLVFVILYWPILILKTSS